MNRPKHRPKHRPQRGPIGLLALGMLLLIGCKPPLREAESLMQAKRYKQAEQVLSRIVAKDPSIDAQALLAQASFYTQGPDVAIDQLQALYPKYQDERSFKQVVDALEPEFAALDKLARQNQAAPIESYLREAHPDWLRDRARWLLAQQQAKGFIELSKSGDPLIQALVRWRQAGKDPEKLAQLLEDFPKSRLRGIWYQTLIDSLWQAKRHKEALDALGKWLGELPERHPRRAEVLLQRAAAEIEDNLPREALQDYRSYLRHFPKHSGRRETIYKVRDKLKDSLNTADHRLLAESAYDEWMYQTAYAELSQVPAEDGASLLRLGQYALKAELTSAARDVLVRVQKFYPGSHEAGMAGVSLASLQRKSKAYTPALNQLQAIKAAYGADSEVKASALWEESVVYDFQNRNDQRAQACREAVATDPGIENGMSALWYAVWDDYLQGKYQQVVDEVGANSRYFAKHELKTRFLYWQARAYQELGDRDSARKGFSELSQNPLMDYYTHRARERLRLIDQGGEDRYATAPYNGFSRARVPNPGYVQAFHQALAGDKEALSELMELYYLGMTEDFSELAGSEEAVNYQVLYGMLLHKAGRHYEAITRYRYPAEENDAYLPVVFPLAFFDKIEAEAKQNGLNPFLPAGLIWQESQYKPDIKSWVGATGLMQIMPETGAHIAGQLGLKNYNLSDGPTNIRMGTWYLKSRLDYFDGNPLFAVASYNAGAGPVGGWKNKFGTLPYDALAESIPYPETRGYVKRVFTSYWIYQNLYGK